MPSIGNKSNTDQHDDICVSDSSVVIEGLREGKEPQMPSDNCDANKASFIWQDSRECENHCCEEKKIEKENDIQVLLLSK